MKTQDAGRTQGPERYRIKLAEEHRLGSPERQRDVERDTQQTV
jgi:hypothetical protein